MPVRELTDAHTDGYRLGQSTADKVGFFGATPIVQPTSANQAAITVGGTTTAANTLLVEMRLVMVNLGLMKGS